MPKPTPDKQLDDILIDIHDTYHKIEFTEPDVEEMCEYAKKLMTLVTPETLIANQKDKLDKMYFFKLCEIGIGHHLLQKI